MRKKLLVGAMMLLSLAGKAQFTQSDLIYYVGDGPDTAVFVIDFLDETADSSYAWGYLFDAADGITGADLIAEINSDENYLNIETGGGFLNNIYYNSHIGEAGDPNYWGTWSRTAETAWELNDGLSEVLSNGDWFGCSYTDFDPPIAPGEPIPAYQSSKYSTENIAFWVGEGNDSAVFVVDFVNSSYGEAVTYAWGYAFDGTTNGGEMLTDIAAADINLTVDAGAFLNDILYNGLIGLAGDPNYWATWSGTNLSDWTMNAGLSTEVNDGDWFGCAYDTWPPRRPFYPISAIDSADFTFLDLEFMIGDGPNQTVIVVDFNEWMPGHSYAFGYMFETETISASDVLIALEEAGIYGLTFDLSGGFLNSVVCEPYGEEGIGGSPYYWGTWSATNVGGWEMNDGISQELSDGDWFACTYTSWAPATPPSLPEAGIYYSSIDENESVGISIYPNPTTGLLSIQMLENNTVNIIDAHGRIILSQNASIGTLTVDLSDFASGIYFVETTVDGTVVREKLILNN